MKIIYSTLLIYLFASGCGTASEESKNAENAKDNTEVKAANPEKTADMKKAIDSYISGIADGSIKPGMTTKDDLKELFGNRKDMNDDEYDSYTFLIDGGSIKLQGSFDFSNDTLDRSKFEILYTDPATATSYQPKILQMIQSEIGSDGENMKDDEFWYIWEKDGVKLEFCDASKETQGKGTKYDIRYNQY